MRLTQGETKREMEAAFFWFFLTECQNVAGEWSPQNSASGCGFLKGFCHCSCWDTRTVQASEWQKNGNCWWNGMERKRARETAGRKRKNKNKTLLYAQQEKKNN